MIPVIMSGGVGSRLWPYSRKNLPKQFGDFFEKPLIESSVLRFKDGYKSPLLLSVSSQKNFVRNIPAIENIVGLYEPKGRNTGPAIAFLCRYLEQKNLSDELIGVFSADHYIENQDEFHKAISVAKQKAQGGSIVTLGIVPDHPATGYGYIELEKTQTLQPHKVLSFKEKPNRDTAQKYVDSKNYFWNAGIFIFKASTMIEALKTNAPEIWNHFSRLTDDHSNLSEIYDKVEPISIDFAVMEKASNLSCVPCSIGWRDLGSWDAMANLEDENEGIIKNQIHHTETTNESKHFVFSKLNKTYSFVNTDNLIVVDTNDALLIANKGESENVKNLVKTLESKNIECAEKHPSDFRPWGRYETLVEESQFKCKRITVLPGERLSYQSHEHRSEHWVILEGQAEVTLDDNIHIRKSGQHIFIPKNSKHRITNKSDKKLVFIEIQTGTYFGEDDITRYEDDYGRSN